MSETENKPADGAAAAAAPEYKKLLIAENKMGLEAPSSQEGKRANLVWDFRGNFPRVTVFTHDQADETEANNNGRITANLDFPMFYGMAEILRMLADLKEDAYREKGVAFRVDNKNFTYENNVRSEKASKVTELQVGRDQEGGIWIGVFAPNRPKIKFFFAPNDMWHTIFHGDGTALSKSELSVIFAKGYARMVEIVMGVTGVTSYSPIERAERPFTPRQGGGGGNWQNRGGGGGGGGWQNRGGGGGGGGNWRGGQGGGGGGGWQNRGQGGGGGGYNRGGGGGYNNNGGGGGGYNRDGGGSGGGGGAPAAAPAGDLPF